MPLNDPELIAEFVIEAREHLAGIEAQLLDIEACGTDVNVELVNTVFREIHSVKGAAGFLGLATVNKLAHSLENVLGKMRNRELVPSSSIVDTMLRAADALTKLINNLDTSNDIDVSSHIEALDAIVANPSARLTPANSSSDLPRTSGPLGGPPTAAILTPKPSEPIALVDASPDAPDASPNSHARRGASSPADASIRVPVGVLDSLMNLAGELVLGRNQLLQTLGNRSHDGIDDVAARLDQVTSELQEAIMQTRMQPIGNIFGKFPRVVRDLSNKLGKQCEVVLEGKNVEVDKTIIEAIGDPLTHLVRNAVDHGIELPPDRAAKGKNACGTVKLRAYHQAGKVRIDVIDDGGGIDPHCLRQKAITKNVITPEQAARMTDRDAVRLIFHPGFSTAEHVTDVSGRGVGMDVVRTNIERLGGTVDVDSTLGRGTTVQITLPLTLAIIPSLIVRSRGERFAIPQVNVLELLRVRAHEMSQYLGRVKDAEVLRLRGSLLPFVRLGEVLELKPIACDSERLGPLNIVVLETGQHRYALGVDEVDDSEEIVVKPLGRHVKSCVPLAGATIMGDGRVALILDPGGISAAARLSAIQEENSVAPVDCAARQCSNADGQVLLLFRHSPLDRFAVPMDQVLRIERIAASDIQYVGLQRVFQYRGKLLPLVRLDDHLVVNGSPTDDHWSVVVFAVAGRQFGLIAPQLEVIRHLPLDVETQTFRERGVAGAFVADGATVRLLDFVELARLAQPDWFAGSTPDSHTDAAADTRMSTHLRRAEQQAVLNGASP